MEDQLSISQKIYLLSVHPQKGGIMGAVYNNLSFVLAGAILLELLLENKIGIEGKKIHLLDGQSSIQVQQRVLEKISTAGSPKTVTRWVQRLSFSGSKIRHAIRQSLYDKRLIRLEQKQFLFFHWDKVYIYDKTGMAGFVGEIENWVFRGTNQTENLYLLSLIIPCGLLRRLFPDRERRKAARQKLKQMGVENIVSKAVTNAIIASRAAAT